MTLIFSVISVTQTCPTLCDLMDCSTRGLLVHHQLLGLAQTHVHRVSDAIQPSHPCRPLLLLPSIFSRIWDFSNESVLRIRCKSIGVSVSALVLPMNIQDWFLWGLTGLISCSWRYSQAFSPTPQFKTINFLALSLLHSPTLTSIHDYWENHSFDYMDLCQQGNVSTF